MVDQGITMQGIVHGLPRNNKGRLDQKYEEIVFHGRRKQPDYGWANNYSLKSRIECLNTEN